MAKILLVIAPANFRDEELFVPKEFFESRKMAVDVASTVKTPVAGMLGRIISPNVLVSDVVLDEYDAVAFIGGIGVEDKKLYENPQFVNLAKLAFSRGKVVAAICIAPKILASAGILKNKKATVSRTGKDYIKAKGAEYIDRDVVQDGLLVTASGPDAARKFAEAIYGILSA